MEVEVKLGVLHKPRAVESQGRSGNPIPQLWHFREPVSQQLADRVEGEVRRIRRVADDEASDMHVPAGRLSEPERRIHTREPLHPYRRPRNVTEMCRYVTIDVRTRHQP